jgi:hypothetical protein
VHASNSTIALIQATSTESKRNPRRFCHSQLKVKLIKPNITFRRVSYETSMDTFYRELLTEYQRLEAHFESAHVHEPDDYLQVLGLRVQHPPVQAPVHQT